MSKSLRQTCLLERFVSGVPGLRSSVDRHVLSGDGAVPNFVIATTLSDEVTASCGQQGLQLTKKTAHGQWDGF